MNWDGCLVLVLIASDWPEGDPILGRGPDTGEGRSLADCIPRFMLILILFILFLALPRQVVEDQGQQVNALREHAAQMEYEAHSAKEKVRRGIWQCETCTYLPTHPPHALACTNGPL